MPPQFSSFKYGAVDLLATLPLLSVPKKNAIAEKSLRFQIAKCKIASFAAEFAEKSPGADKIAAIFRGAEYTSQRFRVFKIAAFSGRYKFLFLMRSQVPHPTLTTHTPLIKGVEVHPLN